MDSCRGAATGQFHRRKNRFRAACSSVPTASTGSRRRPKSCAARGPFATRAEADADLLAGGGADGEFDPESETLQEAESELGISDWIDPDTGGPAEDHIPHIEDH
jgi:hypothetical protein